MTAIYHRIISTSGTWVSRYHRWVAAGLLAAMFGLSLGSMMGDSAIVDEVAHIPSAYSYVHYGDYRLNPEHPPLMKDLAGLPLQFLHLQFPDTRTAWTTDANGQWNTGWDFLYHLGNNASAILFWARLPILLAAVGFGIFFYWYVARTWGVRVGLTALSFYVFSPNILAHSHYVTTDAGATAVMFIALAAFAHFLKAPTRSSVILLSLALALAQLTKFSAVVLFPFFFVVAVVWALIAHKNNTKPRALLRYVGGLAIASVFCLGVVWLWYVPNTFRMPEAVQDRLIDVSIYTPELQGLKHVLMSANSSSVLRPIIQYILGVSMVYGRVTGGNVTYFNGLAANHSFTGYFPELFLVKTQVPLLVLLLLGLVFSIRWLGHHVGGFGANITQSMRTHVTEWLLAAFAAFYFAISVAGNLNLGIRHILPIYAPLFVLGALVCRHVWRWYGRSSLWPRLAIGALVVWYAGSALVSYPSYTAYFNELIGGDANASAYFSDSSVDWGQDLLRLKAYTVAHPEIHELALDYFGGAVPEYYFCNRKYTQSGQLISTDQGYDCSHSVFKQWHSSFGQYQGQYIAVSETYLENDRYFAVQSGEPGYDYLRAQTPLAKIGGSIYLYKLR